MGRKQLERIYDYDGKLIKKQCGKCRKIKSIEEFHKSRSSKDGFYCQCKECSNKIKKEYYKENKEERLDYRKNHYENNKELLYTLSFMYNGTVLCNVVLKRYGRNNSQVTTLLGDRCPG